MFGGELILYIHVINQGDMGLGALHPKLWGDHEVVDGGERLGLFQTFIGGE